MNIILSKKYIILFLRIILFGLSNIGYWELIRRKTKTDILFLPSLTIAIQSVILFVSGLLNLLSECAILLYGFGIVVFTFFAYKDYSKSQNILKKYFTVGFFFLSVSFLISAFYVKGKLFSHWDDFSHWALVVKEMLKKNRFPNFSDPFIQFQSYPLGSSVYIYYFAKMISSIESCQMLAQIYMMLTCIMPLFYFCQRNRVATFISAGFLTALFFLYNTSITSLLVDTLLPIISICSLLYFFIYFRKEHHNGFQFYISGAYLVQIIQIKNSGFFYLADRKSVV